MVVDKKILEDLVNEFGYWQMQKEERKQDPWSSKQRQSMGQKILKDANALSKATPDVIDSYVNSYITDSTKNAIDYTKANLDEIVENAHSESLIPGIIALNKDYQDMVKTYVTKDIDKMQAYLEKELFENKPGLVNAFRYHTTNYKDIILSSYEAEMNEKKKEAIVEVCEKVETEKGTALVPNKGKIKDYITKNIGAAQDDMKEQFYLSVAAAYASEK